MWGTVDFRFRVGERGPLATLARSVVWGSDRLSVEGKDVPRSSTAERPFVVPLADGRTASVTVRARGFDYAPRVFVDGAEIDVARRLELWEYVLAAVPIVLIIPASFVGLVVGFGAMATNQWILRHDAPLGSRVAATAAVDVASFGVSVILLALLRVIAAPSP